MGSRWAGRCSDSQLIKKGNEEPEAHGNLLKVKDDCMSKPAPRPPSSGFRTAPSQCTPHKKRRTDAQAWVQLESLKHHPHQRLGCHRGRIQHCPPDAHLNTHGHIQTHTYDGLTYVKDTLCFSGSGLALFSKSFIPRPKQVRLPGSYHSGMIGPICVYWMLFITHVRYQNSGKSPGLWPSPLLSPIQGPQHAERSWVSGSTPTSCTPGAAHTETRSNLIA